MKGFIEVKNKNGDKWMINLSSVTDFMEYEGKLYVGFITNEKDVAEVNATYEEIKQLIEQAQ